MKKLVPSLVFALAAALGLALSPLLEGPPQAATGAASTRVRDVMGVNSGDRSSTVADIAQAVGWVRDYHRWYWFEPTNDGYTQLSWLDSWYGALKRAGLGVLVTVEFAPAWSSSNGAINGNPYYTGDGTQPAHYAEHAEYMAQLAARYGRTRYAANDARIEPGDKVSGLGYVDYLESYNEPDYWWWTPTFPAQKYAKMLEADYNGYGTTTSSSRPLIGTKRADPSMGMVHGGVLGADTSYLDGIMNNVDPGQVPFDAVNFHIMMLGGVNVGAKSPEAGPFISSINQMKAWRDRRAPGKPVWVTEIGWDTYTDGSKRSRLFAPEANAGNYLLRTIALAIANGVDRVFLYIYKDPLPNSLVDYHSAGLVKHATNGDGEKKAGWYYLATAKSVIGDYVFERAERNGEGTPAIYSYLFNRPETGEKVAMLWARNPAAERDDGTLVHNYRLYAPKAMVATLIEPVKGLAQGQRSSLQVTGVGSSSAYVTLPTVGEKPIFVYYRPLGATTATPTPNPSAAGNLLANPGFEADDDGNGLPDGWTVPSWAASSVSRSQTTTQEGSYSMLHQSTTGPSYTVTQDVPVDPGKLYDLSGWVFIPYTNGNFSFALQLQLLGSNGGVLSTTNMGQPFTGTTGGWVQVTGRITTPSNAAKVRLVMKASTLKATVYLDNFSLVDPSAVPPTPTPTSTPTPTATATNTPTPLPTSASTSTPTATATGTATPTRTSTPLPSPTSTRVPYANLLDNPGMEGDSNADGQPDGWLVPSWQLSRVGLSTEQAHSGSRSVRHSSTGGGDSYLVHQDVWVEAGRSYSFSGWVNIPTLALSSRFSFQIQPMTRWSGLVTGADPLMGTSFNAPTAGWQQVTDTITIPWGAEKARVMMKIENLNGTIYVDDLELVRSDASSPAPTSTATPEPPTPTWTATPTQEPPTPTGTATATPGAASATPTSTALPTATSTPLPTATSTAVATVAQMLANGSFELDADGNGLPDRWFIPSWLASIVSRDRSAAHDGSYSLKLASTSGQGLSIYQEATAAGGASYQLSGWVNVPSSNGPFALYIQAVAMNSWNGVISTQTIGNPITGTTGDWIPMWGTFTLPSNAAKVRVQIAATSLRATILVDELSLLRQ